MGLISTLMLCLCLISAVLCSPTSKREDPLLTLEQLFGTKFPKSAAVLMYQHTIGMDDMWLAKVTFSRSDAEDLLKTEPFRTAKWKPGIDAPAIAKPWWKPHLLGRPLTAQIRLKGGKVANLISGRDAAGDVWVFYFQVFET